MRMYKSLSVVLLCAVMIWYAAAQMREQNNGGPLHGIQVDPMLPTTAAVQENSTLNGRICMTAALRELEENGEVVVRFLLEGRGQTYRSSVRITPDCRSENGLYTSSVICENLDTGTYTLCVESASGARFDYILAEDGSRSKYEIQDQQIYFELSENAKEGSAWFMLREGEVL